MAPGVLASVNGTREATTLVGQRMGTRRQFTAPRSQGLADQGSPAYRTLHEPNPARVPQA